MAIINCPECGKEISDKAVSCPNCGCPIAVESDELSKKELKQTNKAEKKAKKKEKKEKRKNKTKKFFKVVLCILLAIITLSSIVFALLETKDYLLNITKYQKAEKLALAGDYKTAKTLYKETNDSIANSIVFDIYQTSKQRKTINDAKYNSLCALSKEYIDKKNYKGFVNFAGKYFKNKTVPNVTIPEDQYESYYKEIAKIDHAELYANNINVMLNLFQLLPDGYKGRNRFLDAAYCVKKEYYENLYNYLDIKLIRKILSSNEWFLERYVVDGGTWSADDKYLEFYLNTNGSTYLHTDFPTDNVYNSHWSFEGNKIVYTSDTSKVNGFRFEIIDKSTLKMYCYINKQTYTLK